MPNYGAKEWRRQRALAVPCAECGRLLKERKEDGSLFYYHDCLYISGRWSFDDWLKKYDPGHPEYIDRNYINGATRRVVLFARKLVAVELKKGSIYDLKDGFVWLFEYLSNLATAVRDLDYAEKAIEARSWLYDDEDPECYEEIC